MACKHRIGYQCGGYVQTQRKKAKNEGGDERLMISEGRSVAKAVEVEVNSKLGDGGHPQQARREGKERNKDKRTRGTITLDIMVCSSFIIYMYSRILFAFNSILRILHRHFPPPYLSSSYHY